MTRVCVLLNNDFTRDIRVDRELRTLAAAGHTLTLFATRSPSPVVPETEQVADVTVRRVIPERLDVYNALDRRGWRATKAILGSEKRAFEIVHAHDADMLPVGWLLARRWRAQLVYDAHEFWPAIFARRRDVLRGRAQAVAYPATKQPRRKAPPGAKAQGRAGTRPPKRAAKAGGERPATGAAMPRRRGERSAGSVLGSVLSRRWRKPARRLKRRYLGKRVPRRYGRRLRRWPGRLRRRYGLRRLARRFELKRRWRRYGRQALRRWLKPRRMILQLDLTQGFERFAAARSAAVIATSDSVAELYLPQSSVPTNNGSPARLTLRNMCHYTDLQPGRLIHHELGLPAAARVLLYTGWIRPERGISRLLEAMERLGEDVVLLLMGPVSPSYLEEVKGIAASPPLEGRAFYKEPVPTRDILRWTAAADVGVAPILNWSLSKYHCLPNKLFEYVQAGIPVAVSNFPEMSRVVHGHGLGVTFDPEDPADISGKVGGLLDTPGAMEAVRDNVLRAKHELSWEREELKLVELYRALS